MIRFTCECGKQLQAREENAGKLARCPACSRQLTVPLEPTPSAAVEIEEPDLTTSSHERVQPKRPLLRDEADLEEDSNREDRPYRQSAGNSSKAIVSLV